MIQKVAEFGSYLVSELPMTAALCTEAVYKGLDQLASKGAVFGGLFGRDSFTQRLGLNELQ